MGLPTITILESDILIRLRSEVPLSRNPWSPEPLPIIIGMLLLTIKDPVICRSFVVAQYEPVSLKIPSTEANEADTLPHSSM